MEITPFAMELTQMQKRVLGALNARPHYTDLQLADMLTMKRSTVTAARHFLLENKFYTAYLFPDIYGFSVPLLIIKYGDYGKLVPINHHRRMELLTAELKVEENVFSVSSEFKGMSMMFAPGLHPLKEKLDGWNRTFQSIDPSIIIQDLYLPLPMISCYKFMDVQAHLAAILGIGPIQTKPTKVSPKKTFRFKEKKVAVEWLKNHHQSNAEISRKVDVSRAVVGLIKERLLQHDVVRLYNLPRWSALGLELGVLSYLSTSTPSILRDLATIPSVIIAIGSGYEGILLSVFRNYQEYQTVLVPALQKFKAKKKIIKEPEELFFPLAETAWIFNPAPFVEKTFFS